MPSAVFSSPGQASGGFRKHGEALPMLSEGKKGRNGGLVKESHSWPEDVAVRAIAISKCFHLYDKPHDRLKQGIFPHLQRLLRMPVKMYSRQFWALKDVSFELKKGQIVGIIGRNGSGKSTLLQVIAGTLDPTHGKVEVNGRVAALLELGSGFNLEFTGRENVYMNATILGLTKKEIDARFDDIVSFAEIGDFIEQPVKTYSSGMYVRLAFAVQIAVEPDVLIIDEALSVGDMRFSMKCIRRMHELVEKGTSCLFVTHDMSSIVNFCQEAIWLDHGMVVQKGNPKTVTMNYGNFMAYGFLPPASRLSVQTPAETDSGVEARNLAKTVALRNSMSWIDVSSLPALGKGGAAIERIAVYESKSADSGLNYVGGETLEIVFEIITREHLKSPIVAADVRDSKGNLVFGLNTYFLEGNMPELLSDSRTIVRFSFRLPLLLNGKYSISAAIADGSYENHIQHHVINEAILFQVISSSLSRRHYLVSLESASFDVGKVSVEGVVQKLGGSH
jgi:ABC-type polysaccharide/polyol phosphate transport system ATPase subunit